jgi:peptidoglycan-associated lipoprotein
MVRSAQALWIVAGLMLLVGCSKSLQGDVGGQSEMSAGSTSTTSPNAPGAKSGSGSIEKDAAISGTIPPLGRKGGKGSAGSGSGQERIEDEGAPGMIAKIDPGHASGATKRQTDELQRQRHAEALGLRDVYFHLDSWSIPEDGRQALSAAADWLRDHPEEIMTIEGHCDERGTAAYNLVLGEKRANSVRRYLIDLGIKPDKLRVVTYGKERPFCREHDERCYQQNRRSHLVLNLP